MSNVLFAEREETPEVAKKQEGRETKGGQHIIFVVTGVFRGEPSH